MRKFLIFLSNKLNFLLNRNLSVDEGVEYSLKKYRKTYELLEEYDQKAVRDPESLADPERLRPFIRDLQKKARVRRTYPSI